jgi:hypothetical protein
MIMYKAEFVHVSVLNICLNFPSYCQGKDMLPFPLSLLHNDGL